MGCSYSHKVTIKFSSEDDCNLFENYLIRLVHKHHLTRTSGYDIENYPQNDKWVMYEMFDLGFEIDNHFIDYDRDDNVIVLDSCGYGNIPEFIIGYALEKYNAVEFYTSLRACQGQERSNIDAYYNRLEDKFEYMFIPEWVSLF